MNRPFHRSILLSALLVVLIGCNEATPATNGPARTASNPQTTPTASTPSSSDDWMMYHSDKARSGFLANMPDPRQLSMAWSKHLDGAVYAEPLVIAGVVIVATENNSLYAFDAQNGAEKWQVNAGAPMPLSSLPCGNIDPLGITGTPIYDPQTRLVFAVAETRVPAHVLIGVDLATGAIKVRRTIDLPGMEVATHQQRGALALIQDRIYIPFGGLYGDCGNYIGRVIAVKTDGQGDLLSYKVPTTREGGIWAPPGPVIDDQNRLLVAVGNGEATAGQWDKSDSVLRLSPNLLLEDGFAPRSWPQDNANDADLGSMSPVLLPDNQIFIAGKSGQGYLLDARKLGGVGGQIAEATTCRSYGGAATVGTQIYLPCNNGILQITVSKGAISRGWKAQSNITGSPVIGGNTLYTLDPNGGMLYAFKRENGEPLAKVQVGMTSRFSTPTIWRKLIFVGTMQGITAVMLSTSES
jgi:outer membrane protein assembly factor BamB